LRRWCSSPQSLSSQAPVPPAHCLSRHYRPMTLDLALTVLAGIAVAVFVFDAITPPKR
jgi:hypothetical protein